MGEKGGAKSKRSGGNAVEKLSDHLISFLLSYSIALTQVEKRSLSLKKVKQRVSGQTDPDTGGHEDEGAP